MPYRLLHVNKWHEQSWFVAHGEPPPHRPDLRLIAVVTPTKEKSRLFETEPEAISALVLAGKPPGWSVVED